MWSVEGEEREVAVKTLADGSTEEKCIQFLQEAAIMSQFKHPNVITLHGVLMEKEPVNLVCIWRLVNNLYTKVTSYTFVSNVMFLRSRYRRYIIMEGYNNTIVPCLIWGSYVFRSNVAYTIEWCYVLTEGK